MPPQITSVRWSRSTSARTSPDAYLVSYAGNGVYAVHPHDTYTCLGHANRDTMIKQAAWVHVSGDPYILSGSDDGCIFVYTARGVLTAVLKNADVSVVNCVIARGDGVEFASSGIGWDIKIWGMKGQRNDGMDGVEEIIARNTRARDDDDEEEGYSTYLTPAVIWRLLTMAGHDDYSEYEEDDYDEHGEPDQDDEDSDF